MSAAERLEKVLVFLRDVTKPYISIASNGNGNSSDEPDNPYYVSPSISGSGSKQQGSTNFNSSGEVYGNYSSQKWRFIGSAYGGILITQTFQKPHTILILAPISLILEQVVDQLELLKIIRPKRRVYGMWHFLLTIDQ